MFVGVFLAELLLKLWGMGFWQYWTSRLNCFDALIVVISLIEIGVVEGAGLPTIGLSVLRSVWLMRLSCDVCLVVCTYVQR